MDTKVKEYIEKQPSPQKEICLKLREIIASYEIKSIDFIAKIFNQVFFQFHLDNFTGC